MPPVPPKPPGNVSDEPPPPFLEPYPEKLSRRLKLTLFPLDITTPHLLTRSEFASLSKAPTASGSPLAEWTNAFLTSTFRKMETLYDAPAGSEVGLQLHDPLTIWYLITGSHIESPHALTISDETDIRIETSGQWTRGMCVVDRRNRKKMPPESTGDRSDWVGGREGNAVEEEERDAEILLGDGNERPGVESGDHGNWLGVTEGNRVRWAVSSPCVPTFGAMMVRRIFGME